MVVTNDFTKPDSYPGMIKFAEEIGAICNDYVRVDLYDFSDDIALGKVTPFCLCGRGFTEFGDCFFSQAWKIL